MTRAEIIERLETAAVAIRWWMFKRLSSLGWWICPEPHKSNMQSVMPSWDDIRAATDWRSRMADEATASLRRAAARALEAKETGNG